MTALLRAELLKQRSTRTNVGLFATMAGLILLAELLHALGLPAADLQSSASQLQVLAPGEIIGTLFAALLGAMSITGEIRHGTIRPTLLVSPGRSRVITAKVLASMLVGAGFGGAAGAVAVGATTGAFRARGINLRLHTGDFVLPVLGGAVAAALWAAVGVGVGAVIRNQVATLVGLCLAAVRREPPAGRSREPRDRAVPARRCRSGHQWTAAADGAARPGHRARPACRLCGGRCGRWTGGNQSPRRRLIAPRLPPGYAIGRCRSD